MGACTGSAFRYRVPVPRLAAPWKALLALATVVVVWSAVPLLLRHFARQGVLDAWTVNGVRYFFTALFWLPFVLGSGPPAAGERPVWRRAIGPAVCHAIGQAGWGLAPYFNSAGVMNFVSRSAFLFTIVAGFAVLRDERALARRPLFWVGTGATLAGLVILFAGGLDVGNTSAAGIAILLVTSLCWAIYAVLVRRNMQGIPARQGFGIVSLLVAPLLVALLFALGDWRQLARIGPADWILLALSGWIGIALGHVLYYQALRALGPIVAEGGLALVPFLTAVSAHLVLGENLRPAQWIGGTILVLASLLLLHAKLSRARDADAAPDLPSG